jgi:hypothetical protein
MTASQSSHQVRPWSPLVPIGTRRGATRCGPRLDAVLEEVRRGQTRSIGLGVRSRCSQRWHRSTQPLRREGKAR